MPSRERSSRLCQQHGLSPAASVVIACVAERTRAPGRGRRPLADPGSAAFTLRSSSNSIGPPWLLVLRRGRPNRRIPSNWSQSRCTPREVLELPRQQRRTELPSRKPFEHTGRIEQVWQARHSQQSRFAVHQQGSAWRLTLPSSGQPKARFARFRLPLMSNVRSPQYEDPTAHSAAQASSGFSEASIRT